MQEVEGLHADDGGVGRSDWLFDDDLSVAEAGTETYWSGNYCSSRNVQGLEIQKYHFLVFSSEARNVRYNSLFPEEISRKVNIPLGEIELLLLTECLKMTMRKLNWLKLEK